MREEYVRPSRPSTLPVLMELKDVAASYDGFAALHRISLIVRERELVALIGPNGAGKSTALQTISGVMPITSGTVTFEGVDVTAMNPQKRVAKGIVQVPQGRGLFLKMSVRENLEMGCSAKDFPSKEERDKRIGWIEELFPRLAELQRRPAATLSGVERQMLAIGRALMARPKLLLIDEPTRGLDPATGVDLLKSIEKINAAGVAVLLVENNVEEALRRSDRTYVLDTGDITKSGESVALLRDNDFRAEYLGVA